MKHYFNQALLVLVILLHAALTSVAMACSILVSITYDFIETHSVESRWTDWILFKILAASDVLGAILSAIAMMYYGRRRTYGIFLAPNMIGWLLLGFGSTKGAAMAGLIHLTTSESAINSLMPILIGEYATPKLRGVFLYLNYVTIGILFIVIQLLGTFFKYITAFQQAVTGASLLCLVSIVLFFLPESPLWLASKKRYEESEKAFRSLRGTGDHAREELEKMIKIYKAVNLKPKAKMSKCKKIVKHMMRLVTQDFWEPFLIMLTATVLFEITYLNGALQYLFPIMQGLIGIDLAPAIPRICHVLLILTAILSVFLVKRLKRRTFLFSTGVLAFGTLAVAAAFLTFSAPKIVQVYWAWPLLFLFLFIGLCSLCCAPLSMLLMGEIFPLAHKGVGSVATKISSYGVKYLISKLSVVLFYTDVAGVTLIVFSFILGGCLTLLYYMLPETKDKPLQDIEKYFRTSHFQFNMSRLQHQQLHPEYHELPDIH